MPTPIAYTNLTNDDWVMAENLSPLQQMLRDEGKCAISSPWFSVGCCTLAFNHVGAHGNTQGGWANLADPLREVPELTTSEVKDRTRISSDYERVIGDADGNDFLLQDGFAYVIRTQNANLHGVFSVKRTTGSRLYFYGLHVDEWFIVDERNIRDVCRA